jgi:hypothetical protein
MLLGSNDVLIHNLNCHVSDRGRLAKKKKNVRANDLQPVSLSNLILLEHFNRVAINLCPNVTKTLLGAFCEDWRNAALTDIALD